MLSNTGESGLHPSLILSDPVSVPGMGSLILIDAVIHSAAALSDADDSENGQAFTTEVEETTTPLPLIETNLKFEDDLLTINMGALLAEVSDDSVNFPADVLQEKTEEEEIEEMPEREEEEKNVEELNSEQESHLPVTEFFILDPA